MSRFLKAGIVLATIALVLLIGTQRRWFASEPAWRGKTVTEWLDLLELYDFQTNSSYTMMVVPRSPESIAQEPALEALTKLGPKATPILKKRLAERALWESNQTRTKLWARWMWDGVRHASFATKPSPKGWPEFQKRRKNAAAFMLMALGTNANAGFGSFMETYATAPKHQSVSGTTIPGDPVAAWPWMAAQLAVKVSPQKKEEIFEEMLKGLRHTNPWCRVVAIESLRPFPDQLARWKAPLLQLTKDNHTLDGTIEVREAALGELLMIVQEPKFHDVITPAEIGFAAKAVTEDPSASSRSKGLAETVLKLAEEATNTNTHGANAIVK